MLALKTSDPKEPLSKFPNFFSYTPDFPPGSFLRVISENSRGIFGF